MQDGRKITVSIRDLSPKQSENHNQIELDDSDKSMMPEPVIENNASQTESPNCSDSDFRLIYTYKYLFYTYKYL